MIEASEMMLGVMADTHDRLPLIDRAVSEFNERGIELVLHAGDFIAPFVVPRFKPLKAKLIGVYGNNDAELELLKRKFAEMNSEIRGRFGEINIEGLKIAILHGEDDELLKSLIDTGSYNVIVHGHTHKAETYKKGGTLVINPGETCGYLTGESTIAVLDTKTLEVEKIQL
jgi:putative phosphoesterase